MKKQHEFCNAGDPRRSGAGPFYRAVMTPIYATSTYVQESPGKHKGYDYARSINPTRLAYEKCIADLEAVRAVSRLHPASPQWRQSLNCSRAARISSQVMICMGGTFRLFDRVRRHSANLDFTYVDLTDAKDLERAIKSNTRMVWIETPSNPLLKLIDLEAIGKIARERKLFLL